MKDFGSKGATASPESCKKGNWPRLELQAREEAKCHTHLALAAGGRNKFSRCSAWSQSQRFSSMCGNRLLALEKDHSSDTGCITWLLSKDCLMYHISTSFSWAYALPVRFRNTPGRKMELLTPIIIQTSCSASIRTIKMNSFQLYTMGLYAQCQRELKQFTHTCCLEGI